MSDVKFLEGPGSDKDTKKTNKTLSYIIEGAILVLALLLGLMIRWSWLETAIVTSDSMLPTLKRDDRLLVDHRTALRGTWRRGDIVIFEPPDSWEDQGETYIKRVIGLPGETVGIRGNTVFINGRQLQEPYIKADPEARVAGAITLKPGHYWVMGDNRGNSFDSRSGGPLPTSSIRGRVTYRLGPLGRTGRLAKPDY
jgi:signal peptidase I